MKDDDNNLPSPLAYDIKGLVKASGRSRSSIFDDIANRRLNARKAGRRTIILYEDAVAWLKALPVREPSLKDAQT